MAFADITDNNDNNNNSNNNNKLRYQLTDLICTLTPPLVSSHLTSNSFPYKPQVLFTVYL